jgi:AP-1 complex subunit beta-1
MAGAPSNKRDGRYFDAAGKRGEVHELKEELNHSSKERKKDALKKVIQAMTVGSDVSSLFPDVVNCMQTQSLDLKKLVYLYVINYAKAQPELAILAINSFRKDVNDQHNPLLRALAVRTMGCIRLEQMTEYLLEPCRKSCKDTDPYVRKTAAICIAKLYDINPELVEVNRFIEILRDMLGDQNPMVVANAVASLCEISTNSKRNYLQMNEDVIGKLLNALNECTEWGQVFILDALATYDPQSSREAEMILERGVMVRLSHANSAVVLSAIKVMMKFMDRIQSPEVVRGLCKKMTPPLITLLGAEPEIQYVVMRNINLIVQRQPQILQSEERMFVCKYNDPLYVKLEKISVMVQLASERNIVQVLSEFREYASEVDIECVRKSVRAIGQCAIKLDRAAEQCVDCLLDLIKTKVNYVVQEAIVVIRDIFRKYPGRYEVIISDLCENLDNLDEPEAKGSMIWIIGEYAERIVNSCELLESFLDGFHEEPSTVQLALLTAAVKIQLKIPQQARDLVQRVLKVATDECTNPDLRDRGYMYWRLLIANPELAKHVVLSDRPTISDDSFATQPQLLERLIGNICSLASVYHQVPEAFIVVDKSNEVDEEESEEEDDEDEDTEEKLKRIDQEMRVKSRKTYEEESGDDDSGGSNGSSSGSEGGGRSRSNGSGAAPPPPFRPMSVVLEEKTAGQNGSHGLKVAAVVVRMPGGKVGVQMTVGNFTPQPMSGWAIRFNKNSFGFSNTADLSLPELAPNGGTANTVLPIAPNSANSGTPPPNPLYLEVALKTNIDVFYFSLGFDLSAVLNDSGPVSQDSFRDIWGRLPPDKKVRTVGQLSQPVTPEMLKSRMRQYFCYFVVQREAQDGLYMYFSCSTSNRFQVYAEISLQPNGPGIQLQCASEAPPLVPLFQSYLSEVLRVRWQTGPGA